MDYTKYYDTLFKYYRDKCPSTIPDRVINIKVNRKWQMLQYKIMDKKTIYKKKMARKIKWRELIKDVRRF